MGARGAWGQLWARRAGGSGAEAAPAKATAAAVSVEVEDASAGPTAVPVARAAEVVDAEPLGRERPARPHLPLALWALLAAIVVERAVLAANLAPAELLVPATVLVGGTALAATALACAHRADVAGVVGAVGATALVAGGLAGVEVARQDALVAALGSSSVSSWELVLVADMTPTSVGWWGRARAELDGVAYGEVWISADEQLSYGSTVRCVGSFEANEDDDWGTSSRMQGVAGTVSVVLVQEVTAPTGALGIVVALREAVLGTLDPTSSEARALLAGVVCGYRSALKGLELDDLFASCGVAHLVAVSGSHLALVSSLVGLALGRTRLRPVPRGAILVALTAGFVAFCGAPTSAVRAWAMSVVAELSGLVGRRGHPASSVALVALVMALLDPGVSGQLGFLLSVASVLGLAVAGAYVRYAVRVAAGAGPRLPRGAPEGLRMRVRKWWRGAVDALATSLTCQLVTMPLTCAAYSELALVGPLANVAVGGLFELVLALGVVAAALAWAPWLQAPVLALADAAAGALLWALRALAALPGACVAVSVDEGAALAALALAVAALLVAWPRLTRARVAGVVGAMAACALAYYAYWGWLSPARIVVLDVGQGDAIVVSCGATTLLVDTGTGSDVLEALARAHVVDVDAVLVTHLHDDHTGGLEDVLAAYDCDLVLVAEGVGLEVEAAGVEVEELSYGDALSVGGFVLTVVSPTEAVEGDENEDSVVLLAEYDDGTRSLTALLTGDAEAEVVQAAVDRGDVGDIDLLKVGHHGSAASVTDELAAALDAEVAVASAGEDNSYGHPTDECIEALEGAGSVFLCTIDAGSVTVEPGAEGPRVSCEEGDAL